jgi:hypothetical protein
MNIREEEFYECLLTVKYNTYVCGSCGKVQFPDVEIVNDNKILFNVTNRSSSIIREGGKTTTKNICPVCMRHKQY